MRNDYTHITLLLDRSGSMNSVKDAAEEAFNGYLDSQRKESGKCTVTVRQFDEQHDTIVDCKPIGECPRITLEPRGSTALLDAIGLGVNATGATLSAMPENERPGTVIFVIQTDGYENSSHEFTTAKINEMISHQRDKYNWDFVFLGANQDAIATAAKLGIGAASSATYANTAGGVNAAVQSLGKGTSFLRSAKMSGDLAAKYAFNDADRDAMEQKTEAT